MNRTVLPIVFLKFAGISILFMAIVLAASANRAIAYDEDTHADLTNATIDTYVRTNNTNSLPNGVDLYKKLTGEVVTSDGRLIKLELAVRDWIVLGSVEEDWGSTRKESHYYDSTATVQGYGSYPLGAIKWIHDATSQASQFVSATDQEFASGDYTYEAFRTLYFNSPNDYKTYKNLGHLLHVLQDMASPPHVKGLDQVSRQVYEGILEAKYSTSTLTDILKNSTSVDRSGYLQANALKIGLTSISASEIESKSNIDEYFTGLASYVRQNYFTLATIYSSSYSSPIKPTIPPVLPLYREYTYAPVSGQNYLGYNNSFGTIFHFTRTAALRSNGTYGGRVVLAPGNHLSYYRSLAPVVVRYGVGFMVRAMKTNNKPIIAVQTPVGVQSGNVPFVCTITDLDYDRCSVRIEYSEDGGATFQTATFGPGGTTSNLEATPTGLQFTIYWNTDADIGGTDQSDIQLKVYPTDAEEGIGVATANFSLRNLQRPPRVDIVQPPASVTKELLIQYTLTDVDSSVCSVQVQYSLDGGSTYEDCTEMPGSDGTSNLASSPAGTAHTFKWDLLQDVGPQKVDTVMVKIIPSDLSGVGKIDITEPFSVNNESTVVVVTTPTTQQQGLTTISYTIYDVQGRDVDIKVEFSLDGGTTYNPATAASGGDGTSNLSATFAGVAHTYVWDSFPDTGYIQSSSVRLKITPMYLGAEGQAGETANFSIGNTIAFTFVSPAAGGEASLNAPLVYQISGPSTSGIDITVEYSADNGTTFQNATRASYGHAATGLTAASGSGTQYCFVWDTVTDFAALFGDGYLTKNTVKIRLSTAAGGGATVTSDAFTVRNAGLLDSPWPKVSGPDVRNLSRTPFSGPELSGVVSEKWESSGLRSNYSPNAVIGRDGTLYVMGYQSANGYGLFAIRPEDGSIKWYLANPHGPFWTRTAPAIAQDGTIYCTFYNGNTSGYVHAVNSDGSLKWATGYYFDAYLNDAGGSGMTIDPNYGYIYCNGRVVGNSYTSFVALIDNGNAYGVQWALEGASSDYYEVDSCPAIDTASNQVVYGIKRYRQLYTVNRLTGASVWWRYSTGNTADYFLYTSPLIWRGYVYYSSQDYTVEAYPMDRTGEVTAEWRVQHTTVDNVSGPAVGYNGRLYASHDFKLYAYDLESRSQVWNGSDGFELRAKAIGHKCVDKNNVVYSLSSNGVETYLQAVTDGDNSASEKWSHTLTTDMNSMAYSPVLGSDRTVYVPASSAAQGFRAIGVKTPVAQQLTPAYGSRSVENKVFVYGGNFTAPDGADPDVLPDVDVTAVKLVNKANPAIEYSMATFTVINYTTMYVTIPVDATMVTGEYYIIMTNSNGTNTVSEATYTVSE